VALCLCDENGDRLLSDADVGQVAEMVDPADLAAIERACKDHCGFGEGEIEAHVKNSERIDADYSESE
jgi:hypothetical protein